MYFIKCKIFLLVVLCIYLVANLISFFVVSYYGILIVDMLPIELELQRPALLGCLVAIFISAFFIYKTCNFGSGIVEYYTKSEQRIPLFMGFIVGIMQLFGIVAVKVYDYGVAGIGMSEVSPGIIVQLVSNLSPDILFLIYYGQTGVKKRPYINIILYAISATIRGWGGFILILLFIELFHQIMKHSVPKVVLKQMFVGGLILVSLPFIFETRERMRGAELASDQNIIGASFFLLNRMQHFTNVCLITQEKENIIADLSINKVMSYYQDNKIGTRFAHHDSQSLQSYLIDNYLVPSSWVEKLWYIHTGIAGWLYLLKVYEIPLYMLFLLVILLLPYIIVALILKDIGVIPILHIFSVLYLFHGWFTPQINLIITLFLYACINKLLLSLDEGFSSTKIKRQMPVQSAPRKA